MRSFRFMVKGLFLLSIIMGNSCKKDTPISSHQGNPIKNVSPPDTLPKTIIDSLPGNNVSEELAWAISRNYAEEQTYQLDSIDLSSIHFTPSVNPLSINSTATGYLTDSKLAAYKLSDKGWTHPSVLFFPNRWNGYRYWMGITPDPNNEAQYENPHIFASEDGTNWITPIGAINPIEGAPISPPNKVPYNSDVNLLYSNDTLYCFWRANGIIFNGNQTRCIYCKTSINGIDWSDKKLVCNWAIKGLDVIAPSITKDNDKYYCYGICTSEATQGSYYNNNSIRRMQSTTPYHFNAHKSNGYDLVNINNRPWGANQEPWHIEVKKVDNIWFLLVTTTTNGRNGDQGRLFLGYSYDGVNFSFVNQPISNSQYTYKSSIIIHKLAEKNKLIIELWRPCSLNGWQIFYDVFTIFSKFSKK